MQTIDRTNIGEVLRQHIAAKHGTQEAAALALGLTQTDISRSLTGKRNPCPLLLADAGLVARVVYEQRNSQ